MDSSYPSMESSVASLASLSSNAGRRGLGFFDLPAEIRLRIYEYLLVEPSTTVNMDPSNYRNIRPRLTCFLVSRRMHHEAYHVFYGSPHQPFSLYPIHSRFWHTKKPLLARIGSQYRGAIHTIDLRLGPGWSKPPRCWHTGPILGLEDCTSLRKLKIFIECDPSSEIFNGFRGEGNTKETYKNFCVGILEGIFAQVPSLETVEIDAWKAVERDAPLVRGLMVASNEAGKRIVWGPDRGWRDEIDIIGLTGLEGAMAAMGIESAVAA